MTIDELEKAGVADYYLALMRYIRGFIDRNYPLNEEDTKAIINDEQTENIKNRQEVEKVLKASMQLILERKAEENKEFIQKLEQGIYVKPITVAEQNKEIENYIQEMLEALWMYRNSKEKDINQNEIDTGKSL